MTIYVGWDVGGWNSDRGNSRDAVFSLAAGATGALERVGRAGGYRAVPSAPFRELLLEADGPEFLLQLIDVDDREGPFVLAIDALLGWPRAFLELLGGCGAPVQVPQEADQNPFAFRLVDRLLAQQGVAPLSALRDMLGSQSSKALYFLRRFGFVQQRPAIWSSGTWTAIETYPALVSQSQAAEAAVVALLERELPPNLAQRNPNVYADKRDAAYCALLAATFHQHPDELVVPPDGLADQVTLEGWIWYPANTGIVLNL